MFNITKGKMRALTTVSITFSLLFSLISLVVTVTVTDVDTGSFLAFNSSPQVWKLQAMNHHGLQIPSSSSRYTVPKHLDLELIGHSHHRHISYQLGHRHDWAINCENDRTYTNACTRKGYSCDSTGKLVARGYDWWCSTRCRCTSLSPKSSLDQLAIYVNCFFKGENITGFDGTVISNISTARGRW